MTKEFKGSAIYSLPKRMICAFVMFGALFITINAYVIDDQDSKQINKPRRKALSGDTPMIPLYVKYQNGVPISIEIDNESSVRDIISLAAQQFALDPETLMISNHGMKLEPDTAIAESGVCTENLLEIAEDPLYAYLFGILGDLANVEECNVYVMILPDTQEIIFNCHYEGPKLQMNETDISSFEEFEKKVDKYINRKNFQKTCCETYEYKTDVKCRYFSKDIWVQINCNSVSMKSKSQSKFASVYEEPPWILDNHIMENRSMSAGIETRKYRIKEDVKVLEDRIPSLSNSYILY